MNLTLFYWGFFSKRGEVIWVSSLDEALNQTGNFTLIIVDSNIFKRKLSKNLRTHYPQTPILVSNGDKHTDPPPYVRFVKFEEIIDSQIMKEEKLARTELKVEELRKVHENPRNFLFFFMTIRTLIQLQVLWH